MSEPKSKNSRAPTPDQLVNSGSSATIELSEQDLVGVSAGNAIGKSFDKDHKSWSDINGYKKG